MMLNSPLRELLPDLVDGAKQMRAHRAGREPEQLGDLLERALFVVPQAEDNLLLRGERPLGFLDGHAELPGHDLTLRIGPLVDGLEEHRAVVVVLAAGEEADEFAAAQGIAR